MDEYTVEICFPISKKSNSHEYFQSCFFLCYCFLWCPYSHEIKEDLQVYGNNSLWVYYISVHLERKLLTFVPQDLFKEFCITTEL